ncbi:global transactivator [Pyrenophora seminiperda CCB06]|uniref:Global transactivator n=1 Tax=Pyrenophora seminiperda CCB06 TaxID=1302712 RepID=A0A3M7MDA1_9PLEO|nr:global transactivator [Pyrenophora seminiperda CCB06]
MPTYSRRIVVDDFDAPPTKRQRFNSPLPEGFISQIACNASGYESSVVTKPTPSIYDPQDGLPGNTLAVDLKVTVPLDHVASSVSIQDQIRFEPPRTLHCGVTDTPIGRLDEFGGELLLRLVADDEFTFQFLLSSTPYKPETKKPTKKTSQFLWAIVYGPRRRFDDIGHFMTKARCWFYDPVGCDRNVPYMNPHYLSSIRGPLEWTSDLRPLQPHSDDFARASLDVLSGFETTDDLELSATPTALRTELKMHQRQALTFLLRRERGMHPNEDGVGIWLRKTSGGQSVFVNAVTDEVRSTPGPIWRGGLLADEMGLGKTLSMIALIASDLDCSVGNDLSTGYLTSSNSIGSTLIVVPLSLFSVWDSQLRSHLYDGKLTWFMHHGKQRLSLTYKENLPMLTTYQTVESEYRRSVQGSDCILSHHWRRVILDEAHIIRNHNTSTAEAMAALRATSRWAVSGTPIQNSLLDFHGLFKFLQFTPYDDLKAFDKDISNMWHVKPVEEAAAAFKKLLSCVMIRRTKAILDLPSRDDRLMRVPFSHEEEYYYRQIEQPVVEMLNDTTESGSQSNVPWMTAIQQINKLRLFCNLGTFAKAQTRCSLQRENIDETTSVMNARYSMSGALCERCLQPGEASTLSNGLQDTMQPHVYYSACSKFYCADCAAVLQYQSPNPCECEEQPRSCQLCPLASLSTPWLTTNDGISPSSMEWNHTNDISSKVWALVSQIRSCPQEKHVVFSSWTASLDMVEKALRHDPNNVIHSVRIDGKVQPKNRSQAIQQLHENPSIRVILITIGCGACGLDLTAASMVHLLEPQWNPSLEDQALARVHRLGQTRTVTTMRYIMEDSFEEHILNVQDRKKLLATTLLSNGDSIAKEMTRKCLDEEGQLSGTGQSSARVAHDGWSNVTFLLGIKYHSPFLAHNLENHSDI